MRSTMRVFRRLHSTGKPHSNAELTDFIELWTPATFKQVGVGLALGSAAVGALVSPVLGGAAAAATAYYWHVGLKDMRQTSHTITRNFPVLGHLRFILESVRPEFRQYFVESESDGKPFDREHRAIAYQRAKDAVDTLPFGTRRDVYAANYELCVWRARAACGCPQPNGAPCNLPQTPALPRTNAARRTACGPRTRPASRKSRACCLAGPTACSRIRARCSTCRA